MRTTRIAALGLQGLRRTPLRVTLTTLGVTIASGALISMMALAAGLQRQVEKPFKSLGLLNDIEVKPKNEGDGGPTTTLNDEALARMERLPGVVRAYPNVHVKNVKVRCNGKEAKVMGLAMPREADLLGIGNEILVAGKFFSQGEQPECILGTTLVTELGFKTPEEALGATVSLEVADLVKSGDDSFVLEKKQIDVAVVGVYVAPALIPGNPNHGVVLPVDLMKRVPGIFVESAINQIKAGFTGATPGYSSAVVHVSGPSFVNDVDLKIQAMGFHTRTVISRLEGMQKLFLEVQVLLVVVGSVAMIIASLGIVNTLLMSVLERYQEIGLCKAIGAADSDLFVLFLTEAGFIGLAGGITGIGLGWAVAWGLETLASIYARNHGIESRLELFAFPLWLLVSTIIFTTVISILAGVYPALRAARVDPIRALRSH